MEVLGKFSTIVIDLQVTVPSLDGSTTVDHLVTCSRPEWLALEANFPGFSMLNINRANDLTYTQVLYAGWHAAHRRGLTAMAWPEWSQREDTDVALVMRAPTATAPEVAATEDPFQQAPSTVPLSNLPSPPGSPSESGATN